MLPLRTELLGCYSDQDFLAKLHCVRQAFEVGVVRGRLGRLGRGVGSSEQVDHLPSPWYCPLCGFGGPPAGQLTPPSSLLRAYWKTRVTSFSSGKSAGRW